jgi:hypothetical protein
MHMSMNFLPLHHFICLIISSLHIPSYTSSPPHSRMHTLHWYWVLAAPYSSVYVCALHTFALFPNPFRLYIAHCPFSIACSYFPFTPPYPFPKLFGMGIHTLPFTLFTDMCFPTLSLPFLSNLPGLCLLFVFYIGMCIGPRAAPLFVLSLPIVGFGQ